MQQQDIENLRLLMEFEAARTEPPVDFPTLPDLPAGRYIDPRFYELEQEHIWRKSWLFAAHMDELPDPGSFVLWENAGQPLILVHDQDGRINAFYNTCQHRGAPVVTEQSGRKSSLTCKYHGWSYGLDGQLKTVRDQEDFRDFDFSCRALKSVRCETFGNLIFINLDQEAVSLRDWLGQVADEWEEFQFDKCRLVSKHTFDLECNWKIAMEANTEVYHVPNIHPTTVAPMLDDRRNVNSFYPNGHGRMIAPNKVMNEERARHYGRPLFPDIETVGEIGRTCTQSYGVFPNWVSPLSHQTLPPLLFWPTSIRTTRFEVWTFCHPDEEGNVPENAINIWTNEDGSDLSQVLQEDTEFGSWIQKSMESDGFSGVPLSYQEARIYHWNQWADRLIGIENIPEELRVEQVMGDEWLMPNDPRLKEIGANVSAG